MPEDQRKRLEEAVREARAKVVRFANSPRRGGWTYKTWRVYRQLEGVEAKAREALADYLAGEDWQAVMEAK